VVCARGVDGPGGSRSCEEGDSMKVHIDEEHEVRCCKEQEFNGGGWSSKCGDFDEWIRGALKSTANAIISHFGMRLICVMMQMVASVRRKRSRIRV